VIPVDAGTAARRGFRLWHLVAAVTASAPAFALARVLARAYDESFGVALLKLVLVVVGGVALVAWLKAGLWLGRRASRGLIDWGLDHDDLPGFVAVVLGALVYGAVFAGIVGLGLIGTFAIMIGTAIRWG